MLHSINYSCNTLDNTRRKTLHTPDKIIETKAKQNNSDSFEQKLWKSADKLRKNIDAAEYKHIVLGLIFLKYISDAFEVLHQKLIAGEGDYEEANPEDRDEYSAENATVSNSKP